MMVPLLCLMTERPPLFLPALLPPPSFRLNGCCLFIFSCQLRPQEVVPAIGHADNRSRMARLFITDEFNLDKVVQTGSALLYGEGINRLLGEWDLATHSQQGVDADTLGLVERHAQQLIQTVILPSLSPSPMVPPAGVEQTGRVMCARRRRENACELLTFYMTKLANESGAVGHVVSLAFTALGECDGVDDVAAEGFRRIMLAAFSLDPVATAEATSKVLSEQVVQKVAHCIATNYAIADTMLTLVGSHLGSARVLLMRDRMSVLTASWIERRLPECLVGFAAQALRSERYHPYYYFLLELMKRGLCQGPGPFVDKLLVPKTLSNLTEALATACDEAASNPEGYPLLAEGLRLVGSVMALLRCAISPLMSDSLYTMDTNLMAPIRCFRQRTHHFAEAIDRIEGQAAGGTNNTQVELCKLFLEVLKFRLRETDAIIVETRFLEKLVKACKRHPECNGLSIVLHKAITTIFRSSVAVTGNCVVLKHITTAETRPSKGFLSECVSICLSDELRGTALGARTLDACTELADSALLKGSLSALGHVLQPLRDDEAVQQRMKQSKEPITGAGFTGRDCGVQVRHRPDINHAGVTVKWRDAGHAASALHQP
ncbi:hypothetical protein TRVL_00691 [Trypanosoma vivax]|nr:hypothetical protein TRVL_00691 [Trypanosoma vivax]